jgi:hypothetical protein
MSPIALDCEVPDSQIKLTILQKETHSFRSAIILQGLGEAVFDFAFGRALGVPEI